MDFSIVIPAYNCERTILQTVQSICNVNLDNLEVIIVDDGSTDGTSKVCKNIISIFPTVKYFYQTNAGVSAARNYGISKAIGKFILLWDSDDQADSGLLKKCMLTAKEKNADMLIFGMSFRKVYKGKVLQIDNKQCLKEEMIYQHDFPAILDALFDMNYLSSGCNKILKRDLCNQGSFNIKKNSFEDLLYVLELLNYCNSIFIMPDLAYVYEIQYPFHHSSRLKSITDFEGYMQEFQMAVLRLEDTLGSQLPQLREKIALVYEWMLCWKIESSNLFELKAINAKKMRVSLFDEQYEPKIKNNKLFFEKRFLKIRTAYILKSIKTKLSVWLKVTFYGS